MKRRIRHLNCGTLRPLSARLTNGRGSLVERGEMVCHCLLVEQDDALVLVDAGIGQLDIDRRPRAGAFDLLGGHLDGLTWRVTLDDDGSPLLYDTMHNCGCYHWFFPAPRLIARAEQAPLADEGALIPAAAPTLNSAQRIVLRLETGTHFITGVSAGSAAGGLNYRLADYDDLRRLPLPEGGSRSLFGPHGFVAGTERAERFVLWPMGIERPGAMRQWGHHATAFIGRRHFDEARLIERYFERAP